MNFFREIEPYIEYLHSIRKLESYFSIDMQFPIRWGIPKSLLNESEVIPFDSKDENFKGMSFVCEIKESETNKVFTKISNIIKINKEREQKEKLFKETIEVLKQTFEKNDLQKLQTLYFDFENEIENEQYGEEPADIELAE